MPGSVILAALLTIAILATIPDNAHAKSPSDRLQAHFEAGQKSEDSSFTFARTSYETLNKLLLDLDSPERDSLIFVTTSGSAISVTAFVDSFLPLARRRALAETDLFECVLWIGSQFPPDTCYDPATGETKAPFLCPPPPNTSFRFLGEVFTLCRDGNREDLARRIDFRLFPSFDSTEVYLDLVGMASRAGDRARATALLDTAIQMCERGGFCRPQYFTTDFEVMLDMYGFLLTSERQLDLLNRFAECVDTTEANALWYPLGFLARHYFRSGEFKLAESYAINAARSSVLDGLPELTALYNYYQSIADSANAERMLYIVYSLVGVAHGDYDGSLAEFLIPALRENGWAEEADRLFFDREARELATFDPPLDFNISTANFGRYVRFHKLERGKFVLDSLSAGIADGSIEIEKSIEVVRGYCSLKLYSGAERLLQNLGRTTIASKCALAAVSWISGDPYFFQTERFVQYIADIPTRDSAWLSTINSGEGDYGFQLAAKRCRNIVSDEIRLAAITKLAPDIWMGTYDIDIEAEANELCTKVGNLSLAYEWYIRMYKGSSRYYEMAKARFYLTKREEFLRVNQNAQNFTSLPEDYLVLAEDYASCGLVDEAKRLIADSVLPEVKSDMFRERIALAYGNMGAINLALKTTAEMVDPYDRGQALANVACLARSTSVKSDRECTAYLHAIIRSTENSLKK